LFKSKRISTISISAVCTHYFMYSLREEVKFYK